MGSSSAVPMALVMACTASLAALVAARTLRVRVVTG
jgi:DHA1 family bicyclomycin/chloramphenicol resistance-like MFS transporter